MCVCVYKCVCVCVSECVTAGITGGAQNREAKVGRFLHDWTWLCQPSHLPLPPYILKKVRVGSILSVSLEK